MSAKLLNVFADENPDLHRQIGCMSGLFQIFGRRHLLAGRHLGGQIHHKRLPSGNLGAESHAQMILEKNLSRSVNENQRTSVESSRPSLSSSSGSSSFSSLECNKSTQHEQLPFLRTNFQETSPRNVQQCIDSRRGRSCNVPGDASLQSGRQSLDFRDVVKDSIYRDNSAISNKNTGTGEVKKKAIKHGDSPRAVPLSKSIDGSFVVGKNGKPRMSLDLDESHQLLATHKQPHWLFSEVKEPLRSSYEAKEESFFSISKESPRLSCDSNVKSATKLKELPRLSLDSRESTMRGSNFDLKQNSVLKDLERRLADQRISRALTSKQDFASGKNPSNVVAKLMGLEAMPRLTCGSPDQQGLMRSTSCRDVCEDPRNDNFFSNSPKVVRENNQDWPSSPKRSNKDNITVQRQTTNSRFPIEPAPWMNQGKDRVSQASKFGCREAPVRQRQGSVSCEIDKKLEELELLQSKKDFRALKQILDAIQAKRMSETKKSKEQQQALGREKTFDCQSPVRYEKSKSENCQHSRSIESPIVIMKPAKSTKKCSSPPAAVIPLEGLAGLRKVRVTDPTDDKTTSISDRSAKDRTPKNSPKAASDHLHASRNKKFTSGINEGCLQGQRARRLQGSSSPRPPSSENNASSVKTSSTSSPRIQQRKLELEKKSRSSASSISSEISKPRRESKQPSESVSPRAKLRVKPKRSQQIDGKLTERSYESRQLCYQSDDISINSDISLVSQVDSEVTSADTTKLNQSCPARGNIDKLASIIEAKKSLVKLRESSSSAKLEVINSEQPSPISVLDASFYKDVSPSSPANEISCSFKDDLAAGVDSPPFGVLEIDPSTKMKHNKLRNIDILVQKLGQLTLSEEESAAASHIAKLCDTQDPNHRYISEVVLASGLLSQDFRLHESGHAINPDLFLVLEQRRTNFAKHESICDNVTKTKPDPEKLHWKLMFDTVDEILIQKLELGGPCPHPRFRTPSGRCLLQELCSEINQLQPDSLQVSSSRDGDNDSLMLMLSRDVMYQSQGWNALGSEVSGIVLDIERSIFKDLVDEVIYTESVVTLQVASSRRRQLLFAK